MKKNKTVLLGVTSGIAAYKTIDLIKKLRQEKIDVFVVMTKSATRMIASDDLEKASGNKIFTELFEENFDYKKILKDREVEHIALADKTDVMIIAPATANVLAKLAHGFADDFLTTTTLALTAPIIVCPSMNVNMWHNPTVQENVEKLKNLGYIIINPTSGMLACGYEGVGRLAEIDDIKQEIMQQLAKTSSSQGHKIIITAGGTQEKIDDVRYIANRSSGKMGVALAEACYERGAEVLLLRAKSSVQPRYHIKEKIFTTSDELFSLIKHHVHNYHYIYHNAAVSDFVVKESIVGKISSKETISLALEPQKKIIGEIKKLYPDIKVIGFKAAYETNINKLKNEAKIKLEETNADAIVANDISRSDRGFESDTNEVLIVTQNGMVKHLPLTTKKELAGQIVDYIQKQFD